MGNQAQHRVVAAFLKSWIDLFLWIFLSNYTPPLIYCMNYRSNKKLGVKHFRLKDELQRFVPQLRFVLGEN